MSLISKAITAVKNPEEIRPYITTNLFKIGGRLNWDVLNKGVDIMESDWDNLIILDACRFDDFSNQYGNFRLEGTLSKVVSKGSSSEQFLNENFGGGRFPDTVMVSSNGFLSRIDAEFHAIYRQYDDEEYKRPYFPELDETGLTTHPEGTVELAKKAHAEHPNKRLIVHFYPPHVPHYTDLARDLREEGKGVRGALEDGEISIEEARKSYQENLNFVLEYVEGLVQDLPGKTVITADHANLFGEYGLLMHPPQVYVPELVHVPWLEIESDRPKEIIVGEETENTGEMTEDIRQNLKDLGYVDV